MTMMKKRSDREVNFDTYKLVCQSACVELFKSSVSARARAPVSVLSRALEEAAVAHLTYPPLEYNGCFRM